MPCSYPTEVDIAMHLYLSGTPKNDRFQALENQMCSHRLFSMYRDYQGEVFAWLRDIKNGLHTFADYCAAAAHRVDDCLKDDRKAQQMLAERGIAESWPGYFTALSSASERLNASYPKHIMLDSGAFTAWNAGARVTLEDVKAAYSRFLTEAGGLFDEIWLVNLDVITDDKSGPQEKAQAIAQSDRNLAALQAEFGNRVLPVFHQDEGKERLLEVVEQAKGYLCLSPLNSKLEEDRWRWATLARSALSDLDCNVRTHGLATTGNEMMRNATLFSGDSEAWTRHARYGVVDLVKDQNMIAECPTTHLTSDADGNIVEADRFLKVEERTQPRYKGYHIGAERNDWHRATGAKVIDNADHFERLGAEKSDWVRSRVDRHIPFLLAQFDMRARSLVNLAEIRAMAESQTWKEPTGPTLTVLKDGEKTSSERCYGRNVEVRPYPLSEDRQRFLSHDRVYEGL